MPITNMVTCKNKRGEEVFVSLQVNAQKQPPSSENLTLESIYSTVLLFFASCEFGRDVQGPPLHIFAFGQRAPTKWTGPVFIISLIQQTHFRQKDMVGEREALNTKKGHSLDQKRGL